MGDKVFIEISRTHAVVDKRSKVLVPIITKTLFDVQKYQPHQGAQEKARRIKNA